MVPLAKPSVRQCQMQNVLPVVTSTCIFTLSLQISFSIELTSNSHHRKFLIFNCHKLKLEMQKFDSSFVFNAILSICSGCLRRLLKSSRPGLVQTILQKRGFREADFTGSSRNRRVLELPALSVL